MQLVDSHCHINFEPLSEDLDGLLRRARANQVDYLLCVAVNLEEYPQIEKLAADHRNIFSSVGVHPNYTECHDPDAGELVALADNPDVVAIGETGLDYYRSEGDLEWQRNRFRNHIEAAKAAEKPLIIHTRSAARDTMDILEDSGAADAGGVMHCFSEDWETAQRALDIGFFISFSCIVTFRNAEPLREVAKKVPLDQILVETDSPYLAPVPLRGKTNEPSYVRHTAECLAALRNEKFEDFAQATTDNFFRLFTHAER